MHCRRTAGQPAFTMPEASILRRGREARMEAEVDGNNTTEASEVPLPFRIPLEGRQLMSICPPATSVNNGSSSSPRLSALSLPSITNILESSAIRSVVVVRLPLPAIHGRLCTAGRLRWRRDMLAEFPPAPPTSGGGVCSIPTCGEVGVVRAVAFLMQSSVGSIMDRRGRFAAGDAQVRQAPALNPGSASAPRSPGACRFPRVWKGGRSCRWPGTAHGLH